MNLDDLKFFAKIIESNYDSQVKRNSELSDYLSHSINNNIANIKGLIYIINETVLYENEFSVKNLSLLNDCIFRLEKNISKCYKMLNENKNIALDPVSINLFWFIENFKSEKKINSKRLLNNIPKDTQLVLCQNYLSLILNIIYDKIQNVLSAEIVYESSIIKFIFRECNEKLINVNSESQIDKIIRLHGFEINEYLIANELVVEILVKTN